MAPRTMPVRSQQTREIKKVLGEGTYTTTDPQGQINVMRQYQAANLIPPGFNAPQEVSDAVAERMAAGVSKEQALKDLNITLPRSFFDNKGKLIGRKFRDAQSPALIEAWNKATGGLPAQDLGKLEGSEWSNAQKVSQEVGRRLGMKLDLGHFETSASGAPGNIAAAGAEYNQANQAAGRSLENPFRPQTQAEVSDIGMATNKVQGLAEASLLTQDLPTRGGLVGSPLNPYISVLLGTTLNGRSSRLLPTENLETLNYTFDQLVKQGANPVAMYDYIRERAGEGIDINEMSKAGQDQYDVSRFAPTVEAPNAGPLKITQSAAAKGPTVTTKGVPKGLMIDPGGSMYSGLPMPSKQAFQSLATSAKGQLPFAATAAVKPLMQGRPTEAVKEVAKSTAIGMAMDPVMAPVMNRLMPLAVANPIAATAAAAVGTELLSPRAAGSTEPYQVKIKGKNLWVDPTKNQVLSKPGYGVDIRGGQPQLVPRGSGAASKASVADPINRALKSATNEAQYFIVNPIRSAFSKVFGNRGI